MTAYKKWDVVVTDFPYSDTGQVKRRPAVVISNPFSISDRVVIYWVLMITTTELKGAEGDTEILDIEQAGLPHPSIVRAIKFGNVQNSIIRRKVGELDPKTRKKVTKFLLSNLK